MDGMGKSRTQSLLEVLIREDLASFSPGHLRKGWHKQGTQMEASIYEVRLCQDLRNVQETHRSESAGHEATWRCGDALAVLTTLTGVWEGSC